MRRFLNAFAAVTLRELREWRLAFVAAACLGPLAYASPWLPFPAHHEPIDVRGPVASTFTVLFAAALVLVLGVRLASRDLAEGRFAFFFARPVPATALWLGRLGGAWITVVSSMALIGWPTALAHLNLDQAASRAAPWSALPEAAWAAYLDPQVSPASLADLGWYPAIAVLLAGSLVVSLSGTHTVATLARSRNAWLLFDVLALWVVVVIVAAALDRLASVQAIGPLVWLERTLAVGLAGVLVTAGGVQVSRGRTDSERGRRLLSAVLWPLLVAGALGSFGYAWWVTTPGVETLVSRSVSRLPGGEWLLLGGATRFREGYRASFLYEAGTGRSVRLGAFGITRHTHTLSPDGSVVAWARCRRTGVPRDCELWTIDLRAPDPRPRATGLAVGFLDDRYFLSEGGRFLVVNQHDQWRVHDLSTGKLVWSTRQKVLGASFRTGERLRFVGQSGEDVEVLELDLSQPEDAARSAPRRLSAFRRVGGPDPTVHHHPEADSFLVQHSSPYVMRVHHAETGELLAEHPNLRIGGHLRFLSGGRFAFLTWKTRILRKGEDRVPVIGFHLVVLSATGELEQRILLPASQVRLGGETSSGRLLVGMLASKSESTAPSVENPLPGWKLYEVDVASGELTPRIRGLRPMPSGSVHVTQSREVLMEAGGGAVVAWDTETGEHRVVLGVFQRATRP